MSIIGYLSKLNTKAGDVIDVMINSDSEFSASLVKLGGVDVVKDIVKEDFVEKIKTAHPPTSQFTQLGSCISCDISTEINLDQLNFDLWIKPTLKKDGEKQYLLHVESDFFDLELYLKDNSVILFVSHNYYLSLDFDGIHNEWVHLSGGVLKNSIILSAKFDGEIKTREIKYIQSFHGVNKVNDITLAACKKNGHYINHYNGLIESPKISSSECILEIDFSEDFTSSTLLNKCNNGVIARLLNAPTRAIRGHLWGYKYTRYTDNPEMWGAIHFHEDDLIDCNWNTTFQYKIPHDLKSAIYAIKLEDENAKQFYMPFYVIPNDETNKILFIAPTNTYLAYANEHLGLGERGEAHEKRMVNPILFNEFDEMIHNSKELGLSLYDTHADKSGVIYSSWNRPVLNFQPNYLTWLNSGRRHFAADFYILGFLESIGESYDVITDADFNELDSSFFNKYDVVISGSHPEYPTPTQLDMLKSYYENGGNIFYLGGNGWYWVTTFDQNTDRVIEVRRGFAGERNWTSHPAELMHSTLPVMGGTYRHNGRSSRELFGITSAGVGWGKASGYKRTEESYKEEYKFIFENIKPTTFGEQGLILGGAAGDELDCANYLEGTPQQAVILASSFHQDEKYLPFIEDICSLEPNISSLTKPSVRADLVYMRNKANGSILSVGSICWAGAMAYNNYQNDTAQLIKNVLYKYIH